MPFGEPLDPLQPFGKRPPVGEGGSHEDFARALSAVQFDSKWGLPLREAGELIKATVKLPVTAGGEVEGHMAKAAGKAILAVMEQAWKLQAEAHRCFSSQALAHAQNWLADNRPAGGNDEPADG